MKRIAATTAVAILSMAGLILSTPEAKAWWRGGWGVGVVVPPVIVAPPPPVYYAPPPVYYVPAPRRIWIPPHWEGPYFVRGHWG